MRVFVDVGAHIGQTCDEAVKPRWRFDRVVAFEPMPEQFAALVDAHPRVEAHPVGWAGTAGFRTLYGANAGLEASWWPNAIHVDPSVSTVCLFMDASEWLAGNVTDADEVWVKLNCEGAEVEILDNLIDSTAIHLIDHLLIDFDIRKVPGEEREADRILARLADVNYRQYHLAEDVMHGPTHQDRIAAWLSVSGA